MSDVSEGSVDEQLSDQAAESAFLGSRQFPPLLTAQWEESLGRLLSALPPLYQTVSRRTVVMNGIISVDSNPRQRLTQQKCQLFLLLWFLVAKGTLKPAVEPSNESCGSDRPSHRNAEPRAGRFAPSSAHLGSSGAPRPVSSTRAVPVSVYFRPWDSLHHLWEAYLLKSDWVSSQVFLPRILSTLCRLVFSVAVGFCIYYFQANFTFIGTSGMGVVFGSER